jgi:hypothetical protein
MEEKHYLPGDLEDSVRWALREQVDGAEPSPAVWEGIRRRIAASEAARGRISLWQRLRMRPGLQAVAAGVLLIGLGLTVGLSSLPGNEPDTSTKSTTVSVATWQACSGGRCDILSGRLVWLASREVPSDGRAMRRGFIE